jgi:hypothetical protein
MWHKYCSATTTLLLLLPLLLPFPLTSSEFLSRSCFSCSSS